MRKYGVLLFDADMMLFDFDKAEETAFGIIMERSRIEYDDESFSCYKRINSELWAKFGRGEITKEYLQGERFTAFLKTLPKAYPVTGAELNLAYLDALADCSQLFDGAEALCRQLSKQYEMYIVTNGVSYTQKKRFYASPIKEYFRDIFVSEDADAPKPMGAYFDYVFAHIGEDKRKSAVIIGDSLESDIKGGINAGIDTIWYNPNGKSKDTDIIPTAEAASYKELLSLLL